MDCSIRDMRLDELKAVFKRIKQDFSRGEYPPYLVLRRHLAGGVQKGLILSCEGRDVAYAICARSSKTGYVLISLLAVYEEHRGGGFGTLFLEKLKEYHGDAGLIVEVEKPEEAGNEEERRIREKRMGFYRRAGFCEIPGIDYSIWDIPMHLMVFGQQPGDGGIRPQIAGIMEEIYLGLMGKPFIHKMQIKLLEEQTSR